VKDRISEAGFPRISRRDWLAAAAAGLAMGRTVRADDAKLSPEEAKTRDEILARAKELRITGMKPRITKNFLAVGNAADVFMTQATDIAEDLLADYMEYFQARQFPIHPPERRLTLVILATPKQQIQFLGDDDPTTDAYPVFDPDSNRLVFFDLRAGGVKLRGKRERGNTVLLSHETSLLLFENTGLLHPEADVPTAVKDGLADMLENRHPTGRSPVGKPNTGRLAQFELGRARPWIPVARLLEDEKLFEGEAVTRHLAEAESWMMVDLLVRSKERLPAFVHYLEAINARREEGHRLEDARAHLGDLDKLDKELQTRAGEWRTYYDRLPPAYKPQLQ
jgi:Protein of unknown function (DUF1570)